MHVVSVNRLIPEPVIENIPALDERLRLAFGDNCSGLTYHKGVVEVHLGDRATAEDDNAAIQIVLSHDFTTRSTKQQEEDALQAKLDEARATYQDTTLDEKATMGDLAAQVEWLKAEIADLRHRLG